LRSGDREIPLRRVVTVPPQPGDAGPPSGWLLTQQLGGRSECVHGGDRTEGLAGAREETGAVRCAAGLGLAPEEPARFTRQLEVPEDTDVVPQLLLRPRSGSALDDVMRGDPATRARRGRPRRVVDERGAHGADLARPGGGVATHDVDDPSGAASAAVDGDRSTSWHAED